jgi:hypothetical protein
LPLLPLRVVGTPDGDEAFALFADIRAVVARSLCNPRAFEAMTFMASKVCSCSHMRTRTLALFDMYTLHPPPHAPSPTLQPDVSNQYAHGTEFRRSPRMNAIQVKLERGGVVQEFALGATVAITGADLGEPVWVARLVGAFIDAKGSLKCEVEWFYRKNELSRRNQNGMNDDAMCLLASDLVTERPVEEIIAAVTVLPQVLL